MKDDKKMEKKLEAIEKYADIIDLPHPTSKKHKRMSIMNRAAQFAPFAALTGYDDVIKETQLENEKKWEEQYNG